MDTIYVAAALLSAILHAGWNAVVKSSARPAEAMSAQMMLSAVLSLPAFLVFGFPASESWPWIAGSTVFSMIAVQSLLKGYESGGFGVVYPVSRAVSVLAVVPLSVLIIGEKIGPGAIAGVGLIALSFVVLALGARADRGLPLKALLWTFLAGIGGAGFVMCDSNGVRVSGSSIAYGLVLAVTNALAMSWRQRHIGSPVAIIKRNWKAGLPCALAAMASYLLIIWVWKNAPVAPAAALRDTSAIFAIIIAVLWLREPTTPARLVAVLLAAAAVPLIRLG